MKIIFASVAAVLAIANAEAATLLVSNNNDSGPGSLRQAILDNNSVGGGTIVFSNIVTGAIVLTNGELLIMRDVTIIGPGPDILAINGNYPATNNRVFDIEAIKAVAIMNLTITDGHGVNGGGIYNAFGSLVVSNCVLSGNLAADGAAIYNEDNLIGAQLTVIGCTISGNSAGYQGGGIFNNPSTLGYAAISVIGSTFRSNTANFGGAIFNNGSANGFASVSVNSSTFSGNVAFYTNNLGGLGGAIFNNGQSSSNATVSISTSTFNGNSADEYGGGVYNNGYQGRANLYVSTSTFSSNWAGFNGGSVYNYGPGGSATGIANACTFAGNLAPLHGEVIRNYGGTFQIGDSIIQSGTNAYSIGGEFGSLVSLGYNLISDNGNGLFTGTNDQINTDAMLGPLQDNGGPTFTHRLLPGSPAIDKGKRDAAPSLALSTDQRGAPRPIDFPSIPNANGGDGSDIGAFELGKPTLSLQKSGVNVVLSWPCYYGDFSVQSSTNTALSNSWIIEPGARSVVGNQYLQTNSPAPGEKFFRLSGN